MYPKEAAKHDAEMARIDRDAAAQRALEAKDPKAGREFQVCRDAQERVEMMLKAPGTADFPSCVWHQSQARYAGDGHYNFSSYVDAQNSFGARIRTYYDGEALIEGQRRGNLSLRFTRLDLHDAAQPEQAEQPALTGLEAQACEAVKQAIRADLNAPASATFGRCDAVHSKETDDWTVAVAINIPHTDEKGRAKPDTFYYGVAKLDPVTHEMKGGDLVHN
jgi:hypothetical protein